MADDRVLFLALGGTRRRAAVAETAQVVARGGTATLVVTDAAAWRGDRPAEGVRLVDLTELERTHGWMPVQRFLLVRLPERLFRLVGRGPLRPWSTRATKAYRRRVADPLHERWRPLSRGDRAGSAAEMIRGHLRRTGVQLVVVNDPASMPAAVALLRTYDRDSAPRVAYHLDRTAPADPGPPGPHDSAQPRGNDDQHG